MTQWLIRRFSPEGSAGKGRGRAGTLVCVTGLLCNLLLVALKVLVSVLSGSVAVMADAVNNLSDAASGLVSLAGFRLARKPADREHPFGHARYEYLAGLAVAVLVMIIGAELLKSSVQKIIAPEPTVFSPLSAAILALSILIKLWLSGFYKKAARALDSGALLASAADSRNDVIATGAVLLSLALGRFAGLHIDGWMGLGVAVFILWSGWGLVRSTLDPLLGAAPDPQMVEDIRQAIMSYPGVLGTHDLMLHDYGPGRRFASVHVEVAAEEDVLKSHDTVDEIERDFEARRGISLVVHMDPIVTRDPQVKDMRLWLSEAVRGIHPELTIHDLRLVKGARHHKVIFDCVKPPSLDMSDGALKNALAQLVWNKYQDHYCVITVDHGFSPVAK